MSAIVSAGACGVTMRGAVDALHAAALPGDILLMPDETFFSRQLSGPE